MQNDTPPKRIFVFWDPQKRPSTALQQLFIQEWGPKLLAEQPDALTILVHDEHAAAIKCPAPPRLFEQRPIGQVSIWSRDTTITDKLNELARKSGLVTNGYLADETLYTDYGDNPHGKSRNWPDGERSPGVMLLTLMERPRRLDKATWLDRWYNRQSPMSEAMQPRTKYIRNLITQPLTPGAWPLEGIVEEAWPSKQHIENPYLFYGAANRRELVRNQLIMLHSVSAFLNILKLRTNILSEYILKSRGVGKINC